MAQRLIILIVTIVALGAAGIWAWQGRSAPADATLVPTQARAPVEKPGLPTSSHPVVAESAPPVATSVPARLAPPASDNTQITANTKVDPPDVDTPEPAAQKFARGGHEPDER